VKICKKCYKFFSNFR